MNVLQFVRLIAWTFFINGVYSQSGTYFIYEDRVYSSYSTWMLSFTVDITPFENRLDMMNKQVDYFDQLFREMSSMDIPAAVAADKDTLDKFSDITEDILFLLEKEASQFRAELAALMSTFAEMKALSVNENTDEENEETQPHVPSPGPPLKSATPPVSKREKRAIRKKRGSGLLPFIGTGLNYLFGVSTHSDIRRLRKKLEQLQESQKDVLMATDEAARMLNVSHTQVQVNRDALNTLQNATLHMDSELTRLYEDVRNFVHPMMTFTQLTNRIHNVFHIVNTAMRHTHDSLETLYEQIISCSHGKLPPTLVPPSQLSHLLQTVRDKLPAHLTLPHPLRERGMGHYYSTLKTVLIPDMDKFHVLSALPIVPRNSRYEIYRVVTAPLPQSSDSTFGATYDIESSYLAITDDRSRYSFLEETVASKCLTNIYCELSSPQYSVTDSPSCLTSLFLKNNGLIKKHCSKRISHMPRVPTVRYLTNGNWLISSIVPFTATMPCENSDTPSRLEIPAGIKVVELEEGCSLQCSYFSIPTYTRGETEGEVHQDLMAEIDMSNTLHNIWDIDSKLLKNYQSINHDALPNLQQVEDLPIDALHGYIKQSLSDLNNQGSKRVFPKFMTGIGVTTLIAVIGGVVAVVYVRFVLKKKITRPKFFNTVHEVTYRTNDSVGGEGKKGNFKKVRSSTAPKDTEAASNAQNKDAPVVAV